MKRRRLLSEPILHQIRIPDDDLSFSSFISLESMLLWEIAAFLDSEDVLQLASTSKTFCRNLVGYPLQLTFRCIDVDIVNDLFDISDSNRLTSWNFKTIYIALRNPEVILFEVPKASHLQSLLISTNLRTSFQISQISSAINLKKLTICNSPQSETELHLGDLTFCRLETLELNSKILLTNTGLSDNYSSLKNLDLVYMESPKKKSPRSLFESLDGLESLKLCVSKSKKIKQLDTLLPLARKLKCLTIEFAHLDNHRMEIMRFPETISEAALSSYVHRFRLLQDLSLTGSNRLDLDFLLLSKNLQKLSLHQWNLLEHTDALGKLTSLEVLHICEADALEEVDGLSALVKLKDLTLKACENLNNINGIGCCTELVNLNLNYACIQDFSEISRCKKIQVLNVAECQDMQNADFIQQLHELRELHWSHDMNCSIEDLSGAIKGNKKVFELHMDGNVLRFSKGRIKLSQELQQPSTCRCDEKF